MATRRARRARQTIDGMGFSTSPGGAAFGSPGYQDWGPATPDMSTGGWVSTDNPDIIKKVVPTGTTGATEDGATTVSVDFPAGGFDTWYKPTAGAYTAGRAQAALDTIQATATQIANVGTGLINNFIPLLLGAAVLFLFLQSKR